MESPPWGSVYPSPAHHQSKLRFHLLCEVSSDYSSSQLLLSSQDPFWIQAHRTNDTQVTVPFIFFYLNAYSFVLWRAGSHITHAHSAPVCLPRWSLPSSHRLRVTPPSGLPKHPFPSMLQLSCPCAVVTYVILCSTLLPKRQLSFLRAKTMSYTIKHHRCITDMWWCHVH